MRLTQHILGKYYAATALAQFMRHLANWRAVWQAYRTNSEIPGFEFRSGLVLAHGAEDDPIACLREIFVDRVYTGRRFYTPRQDHTVIDIGANVGLFAHYLASRCGAVRIHCFEPGAEARRKLVQNLNANALQDVISVHPVAVSDRRGSAHLHRAQNSAHRSLFASEYVDADLGDDVETVTLDDAVAMTNAGRIDLLKIDAEGAEVEIVEGAAPPTWASIDRVAFEFHEEFRPGSRERVCRTLAQHGFRHFRKVGRHSDFAVIRASR
jgi:FkbM family methyltransferase